MTQKQKTISFLIPVYNEEKRINATINALKTAVVPEELKLEKVIFVNDGSTDNTLGKLNYIKDSLAYAIGAEVEVVTYKKNRGKGHAVKTGMLASNSDYTLFFDADMATPLTELKKFVSFFKNEEDIIIGTRKNGESTVVVHQPLYRELMGKVYTFLSQLLLNTWVTDFTCGFKAFLRKAKNDIFNRSQIDRWGYDSEILFIANRLGYKINEKAVKWYDDSDTRVNLSSAVISSFTELMKIRLNHITGKYNLGFIKSINPKYILAKSN